MLDPGLQGLLEAMEIMVAWTANQADDRCGDQLDDIFAMRRACCRQRLEQSAVTRQSVDELITFRSNQVC